MKCLTDKIVNILKKAAPYILAVILLGVLLGYCIPRWIAVKPAIDRVEPSVVMQQTQFDPNDEIHLYGHDFSDVIGIYINGKLEKQCEFYVASDEEIIVKLPYEAYSNPGITKISVEKRVNADILTMSNEETIEVLSLDTLSRPTISEYNPKTITYENAAGMDIILSGEGIDGNESVLVNNSPVSAIYDMENNAYILHLNYGDWYNKSALRIKLRKQHNGYDTSITSNTVTLGISDYVYNNPELEYDWTEYKEIVKLDNLEFGTMGYISGVQDVKRLYEEGNRVFDMSFDVTADGFAVASTGVGSEYVYNDVAETVMSCGYSVVNAFNMVELLQQYEDMYIVVDLNGKSMYQIADIISGILEPKSYTNEAVYDRIIVKVTSEDVYKLVSSIYNFSSYIYVLNYRDIEKTDICEFLSRAGIKAFIADENIVTAALDRFVLQNFSSLYINTDAEELDENYRYGLIRREK